MARTELTPTQITRSGVLYTATAGIADGHKFTNTGKQLIRAVNTSGAATRDITIQSQKTVDGLDLEDVTVTLPISGVRFLGPFPVNTFNVSSGGDKNMLYIDYDSGNESDIEVEVYTL